MPIDTSIADMPWLLQPANPGASLAQGVAAGSRIAQNYLQGVGLAQRQMEAEQELNMRQRKLAMELAQAPLRQRILQQQSEMNAVRLADTLQTRQDTIANEQAYQGLSGQVADAISSPHPENAEPLIWRAISSNKGLYRHPGIKPLLEDARASVAAKLELKAKEPFTPGIIELDNPIPGMPSIPVLRTSAGQVQLLKDPTAETRTPQEKNAEALDKLKEALNTATASGNPVAIADAERKLQSFIEVGPPSDTISFDPATGKLQIEHGRPGGALPTGTVNDIQKRLGAGQRTAENIASAIGKISPDTVGIPGIIRENWEWVSNTLNPGSVPTTTTDARQTFRIAAHNIIQSLKTDSQISTYERKALDEVADITNLKESDPTARRKYATLLSLTGLQGALDAHRLKQPAPDWALRAMDLEQSKRAFSRGDITRDEVRQWWKLHPDVK